MFYDLESKASAETKKAQDRLEKIQTILSKSNNRIDLWEDITPPLSLPNRPEKPALKLPKKPDFVDPPAKEASYKELEPKKDDPRYWKDLKDTYQTRIWLAILGGIIFLIFILFGGL